MAKQLLVYENAQPISKVKHRDWSVKTGEDFSFSKEINSVPLTAIEFPAIVQEYAIVFTGQEESLVPVAILGVRNNENMYLKEDMKTFSARYVPAFLRRYPFVFASDTAGTNFTLCIDSSFTGCNQEGKGERLFDTTGEQTGYLKNVMGFLKAYQVQFRKTKSFCKRIEEMDLLEPMTAQIKTVDNSGITLTGFKTISRSKLKKLSTENLEQLIKTDELELIYLHMQSLRNMEKFIDILGKK